MLDRTLKYSEDCAFAHFNNVSIVVWRTRADAPHVDAMIEFTEHLAREHSMLSVIHVVEETAGLPTPEGRDRFVALRSRSQTLLGILAVWLPKSSVLATMLRAFVRGLRTIARGNLQIIFEQDLEKLLREFVRLHGQRTGVKLEPSELKAAIVDAQRLLGT